MSDALDLSRLTELAQKANNPPPTASACSCAHCAFRREMSPDVILQLVQEIEDLRGIIVGLKEVALGKFRSLAEIDAELEREP